MEQPDLDDVPGREEVSQNSGDQRLSRERGELETLKIKRSERFGVRPNTYAKRNLLNSGTPDLLRANLLP